MRRIGFLSLCAFRLAARLCTPGLAGVASVTDGDFELDPTGQITNVTPTSTGWYVIPEDHNSTHGYSFIMDNSNTTSETIHLHNNTFVPSPEPTQFLGQDSICHPASINQDITGLTPANNTWSALNGRVANRAAL
jgi:hypothetical protein